ncbi:MAG: RluA family pseudouridine synthase [Bacteroidales bacterium]|jgi:23S rRNA pseudouridine1911/1915/1917 synthase|nr:RluA family pseudouridine synthase [Bacteroidales bacterium]
MREFDKDAIQDDDISALYEHYKFTVDQGQSLLRIDKWLMNRIESATRNKIQSAIRIGMIMVNYAPVKSNYRVKPGDKIVVALPEPPLEIEIIPQDIPIDIVYEDGDVIVVNKDAGMVVHPGYGNYSNTLLNALTFHFRKQGLGSFPFLVHRIDKDTSGLLVVAKTEDAQMGLARQFFDHSTERRYTALVWGDFEEDEGTITGHVGRNLKDRKVMSVYPDGEHGKRAVTHYRILRRFGYTTLVECILETGRTHQIRAHFKHINHPLFNDAAYGGNQILKGTTFAKYRQFIQNCFALCPRQALHARTLGFNHPTTQEKLSFSSRLPRDMASVIEKWEEYVTAKEDYE